MTPKKLVIVHLLCVLFCFTACQNRQQPANTSSDPLSLLTNPPAEGEEETDENRYEYQVERWEYEYDLQRNPISKIIPPGSKELELKQAQAARKQAQLNKIAQNYTTRGPDNLGGRTRAVVFDRSDNTGNTIIAGGISGGVFRSTDKGNSWTKTSANDDLYNVSTIVQDPSNLNIWYYGTGEAFGNSASLSDVSYSGDGIWKSTDGGISWTQIANTDSNDEIYDSLFDFVIKLEVHPTTGDVFAACNLGLLRLDQETGTWNLEIGQSNRFSFTDVVITSTGQVYAAYDGRASNDLDGVWTSANGEGGWTKIAGSNSATTPANWNATGRIVIASAPSDERYLYVLYANGVGSDCQNTAAPEADLWRWDEDSDIWTNYSDKLPDEPGCSNGNDPLAIQSGYDLIVSVKPDNPNYVTIGGTNAYRIANIVTDATFTRIGGYNSPDNYALYQPVDGANNPLGATHHPDIHALVYNPFNTDELISGTDGGVHLTTDISSDPVIWNNLNNGYQTYQYYHVAISPIDGSSHVMGGAQDNGTTLVLDGSASHFSLFGGDGVAVEIGADNSCNFGPYYMGAQLGTFFRFCTGFVDIAPISAEGTPFPSIFVTYFYLDPDNQTNLYYAARGQLFRTADALNVTPTSWDDLGILPTADYIRSMVATRGTYGAANSHLFIGGDEGSIFRVADPANVTDLSTVDNITPPGVNVAFPNVVSSLAIHPTNSNILMATYSSYGVESVYLTTNALAANPIWTAVQRNLTSASVRSSAITETGGETMYFIGTARGLYSSPNPANTDWTLESPNTIGLALVSSLRYRPSDSRLLVGTHGRGMYESSLTAPLAVEGLEFAGTLQKDQVALRWTTLAEINNRGFAVERSFDGKEFSEIGFVKSQSLRAGGSYQFADRNYQNLQYYRLKQMDLDGKFKYSNVISIRAEQPTELGINLFPNPVGDVLNLQFSESLTKNLNIRIISAAGKVVRQTTLTANGARQSKVDANITTLPTGNYFLQITDAENRYLETLQFVKQ